MDKALLVVRLLGGLMLVVFGANKFLHFIQMEHGTIESGAFMMALFATGYIMKIVAVVEIVAGVAFLTNKYVPLMAVILFPIMLNAFLMHLFLDPAGIGGAAIILSINIILMYVSRQRYKEILKP